jgi:hypothetical protein
MQRKLRSQGGGGSFSATCVVILFALLSVADVAAATGSAGPLRDPWSRGSERFIRKWLLLGPVAAASAQLDANALQPAPGAMQTLADGITSKWTDHAAFHDTVDLLEAFPRPVSRGRHAEPEVAYAYATIIREQDGDALLSWQAITQSNFGSTASSFTINSQTVPSSSMGIRFPFDSQRGKTACC